MYGLIVHKPSFKRLKWQLMIYSVPVTVEPTNKFWNFEAFSDNFYVLRHNAGQKKRSAYRVYFARVLQDVSRRERRGKRVKSDRQTSKDLMTIWHPFSITQKYNDTLEIQLYHI